MRHEAGHAHPQDFPEQAQFLVQEDEALIECVIAAEDEDFIRVVGRLASRLPTPLQQMQGLRPAASMRSLGATGMKRKTLLCHSYPPYRDELYCSCHQRISTQTESQCCLHRSAGGMSHAYASQWDLKSLGKTCEFLGKRWGQAPAATSGQLHLPGRAAGGCGTEHLLRAAHVCCL